VTMLVAQQPDNAAQVTLDITDPTPLSNPFLDAPKQLHNQLSTIDEHAIPHTPKTNMSIMPSNQLFHYARVYRKLAMKGLMKLTIAEICKMSFIHKLLSRYIVKPRVSTSTAQASNDDAPHRYPLGSIEFEVIGEKSQSVFARLRGYMYDLWASLMLKEDFGAVYYNDWRYVNISFER